METYVLDTVALARYFEDDLPKSADRVFHLAEQGRAKLLIPSIVLGEFIYSAMKGRLKVADLRLAIVELLQAIEVSEYLSPIDMTLVVWQKFLDLNVPELHDRMICAIALAHDVTVITNDPEIRGVVQTIW